ncbi:MAG: class I SAM-dependent methyltransferase [Candidatus Paceibacterota bacterium]|jgi:2-polyprenyl-3-methyl-5-hydroxy-6-metoxy-1,4-benzoquinol methylase
MKNDKARPMYPEHALYERYKETHLDRTSSDTFPDVTKRVTLENMNYAINLCEAWDFFLDIGGGSGHYAAGLAGMFKRGSVIEIDAHPEQQDLVRLRPNVSVVNKFIEECEGTEKADFILLADIFEHIKDVRSFASHLARLQSKGAIVYIMTPNPFFCGPVAESGLHHTLHPNGHISHYTRQEISSVMEEAGYELIFNLYEEGPFRQKAKRVIKGISKRDKKWHTAIAYRIARPLLLAAALPLQSLLARLTYRSEKELRKDEFSTMTQDLAFKKMR